jgi:GDP-L-fucose synthase
MFKNQKVLVTGGSGMIGRSLVKLLLERGALVTIADLTTPTDIPEGTEFIKVDLRNFQNCLDICKGKDYIFHLAGVKGSPKMCMEQPVDFMVPMLQFNTNMTQAAFESNVKWYMYTSSVGVYSPSDVFYEESVWETFPSPNDKYPGWAKRIGELQTETYKKQYGWDKISIVRPANVYGPYDNFNPENAMVIPSLIRKAQENDVLEVFGDGTPIRDFIYADDVALGMLYVVENKITEPLNLGSGGGHTIKNLVDIVLKHSGRDIGVKWLTNMPSGDTKRIMSTDKMRKYGFTNTMSLDNGIKLTTEWFLNNKEIIDNRYNPFINH